MILENEGEQVLQTPTLTTRFTETYGVKHPIAAAGMAFVTLSPRLTVAVSDAGALGPLLPDYCR